MARYSGEVLGAPASVNEEETVAVAERIRKSVEGSRVSRHVTLSIGVAVQTSEEATSPEQLQRKADEALSLAKQTGRNRVLLLRPEPTGLKRGH